MAVFIGRIAQADRDTGGRDSRSCGLLRCDEGVEAHGRQGSFKKTH